jgi:hypothetical protein
MKITLLNEWIMRLKLLFIMMLFVAGWAALVDGQNQSPDNTDPALKPVAASEIQDKEFLFQDNDFPVRKMRITRAELLYDAAVLTAAFERAYSGRDHLPSGVYEKLIRDVQELARSMPLGQGSSDGDLFCSRLADIFWTVPDNHLFVGGRCKKNIDKPAPINVGENIHQGQGYYYKVRKINGKRIGLLSFGTNMPPKEDKIWKGLEEKITNISNETDSLVIDLRENEGGWRDKLRWLADYLYGNPAKMADEIKHHRESATAYALDHNEAVMEIIYAKKNGERVQDYWIKQKDESLDKFKKREGQAPGWSQEVLSGSQNGFDATRGYNKPIRILIDGGCASACEGGFACFLSHPQVRTYGANTSGAVHFGDTVPLVLPKSGVIVSIPYTFSEFSDGRFVEKTGYAPQIPIANGSDALKLVLKELSELP